MVGTAAAGRLTPPDREANESRVRFEVASPAHDAAIRKLLRENPMPGEIALSLEREPSYFAAAAIEGDEHQTIVAIENGRVVSVGSISARLRFINGSPMRVGYLGGLRMDASARGRSSIILRGYDFFHRLHERGGPLIYLTSIIDGNLRARRFLERGLAGMPTYRFLGNFITLTVPVGHREQFGLSRRRRAGGTGSERRIDLACAGDLPEILELLDRNNPKYQFAPLWQAEELLPQSFRLIRSKDGTPEACAAVWDQRSLKQAVVRGYSRRLQLSRPLINVAAGLLSRAGLPRVGEPVPNAFISHLAVNPREPELAEWLVGCLCQEAAARSIGYLALGFDARDARLRYLRKAFRAHEYASRLYAVHWEDGAKLAASLDDRLLAPEVALL
jgi:hypothetical protein